MAPAVSILKDERLVSKQDPLVVALKEWVDREYADGRTAALSNEELEDKIAELSGGQLGRMR